MAPSRIKLARSNRSREHTLYRLFDAEGTLLYVGISFMPDYRFKQHRREKPWWAEVTRKELTILPDRKTAEAAEIKAIAEEDPLYNIQRPSYRPKAEAKPRRVDLRGKFFSTPEGQVGRISGRLGGEHDLMVVELYQGDSLGPTVPATAMGEWEFFPTRQAAIAEGL